MGFSGCATLPKRPDAYACVVNALGKNRKCFNMLKDFDEDGNLLATAKPYYQFTETVNDVDKFFVFDPVSFTNLKAYMALLRKR